MIESIAHIGVLLKAARLKKKLSQRDLSKKTRIPQGHISKIENGAIDLQTSSLIEISRALDLEPLLVPSYLVPTFEALMLGIRKDRQEQIPNYRLNEEEEF